MIRNNDWTSNLVIGKLHDIIVEVILVISTNMKNINQTLMPTRDGLKNLYPFKFSLECFIKLKVRSTNNFNRSHYTCHPTSQPNLSVRSFANPPNNLVIRDFWYFVRHIKKVLFQAFEFLFSKLNLLDALQDKPVQY